MHKQSHTQLHWSLWLGLPLLITVATAFILLKQSKFSPALDVAAPPIYIASTWVKEHVSYQFQPAVTVPSELPHYELQYSAFDRTTLDALAQQLQPNLIDAVTEDDQTVTYQTPEQSLNVQRQSDGSVNFEYHLFQTPEGAAYATENKIQLSSADQALLVQNWLTRYGSILGDYNWELVNGVHGTSVETLYGSTSGDTYRFEVANFAFYNGQLQTIYGWLVTGVTETGTVSYGSNQQIEEYLNTNPSFPYYSKDFPDVDVKYQITSFRQGPFGLELRYEMMDPEATRRALNINHPGFVGEGSAYGTIAIGTTEEQTEALVQLDRYLEE